MNLAYSKLNPLLTVTGLVVLFALAVGCKTLPASSLATFSTGVTSAKTQSEEAFQAINDLISADQLDDAAHATNLNETLFASVLDAPSLSAWDNTLAQLETYAQHLQALTAPGLTTNYVTATENLGTNFQAFAQTLQAQGLIAAAPAISPGIATAFTEIGSVLIRARGQQDAVRIAAAADPSISQVLQTMADSIGETSGKGLRGTVRAHWLGRLGESMVAFKLADEAMQKAVADKPADKEKITDDAITEKKGIASDFLTLMQKRDAEDALLASLRRSLLSLASLHNALAKGATVDARGFAQIITDEIKNSRDIYAQFASTTKN